METPLGAHGIVPSPHTFRKTKGKRNYTLAFCRHHGCNVDVYYGLNEGTPAWSKCMKILGLSETTTSITATTAESPTTFPASTTSTTATITSSAASTANWTELMIVVYILLGAMLAY